MNSLVKFWSEFNFAEPPFIHPQDDSQFGRSREFADRRMFNFDMFLKSDRFPGNEGFHLSLLPMPYVGDLENADIFILLLNPGFNVSNYQSMEDPIYRTQAIKTLLQDFVGTNFPFMSLNPELASSAGFQWWHKKLAGVIEVISRAQGISYLDAMSIISKRIAAIEMVPYRSKSFSAGRLIGKLPSAVAAQRYVRGELLDRARRGEVTLIVTRQTREWGLSSAEAVVYEGGHTRGAHLGPTSPGGLAILARLGLSVAPGA